jgi:hypothetical protein
VLLRLLAALGLLIRERRACVVCASVPGARVTKIGKFAAEDFCDYCGSPRGDRDCAFYVEMAARASVS